MRLEIERLKRFAEKGYRGWFHLCDTRVWYPDSVGANASCEDAIAYAVIE